MELRDVGDPWGRTDAIAINGRFAAFIVKQSCLSSGETEYALYVADLRSPAGARRVLEAPFLTDLSSHPRTNLWTVRADFGDGTQLYDVDAQGKTLELVHSSALVDWGGEISFFDAPHKEGVMSYGWAPDGLGLWYVRPVMRPLSERRDGFYFDPSKMQARDVLNDSGAVQGIELRYFSPMHSVDRQLAEVQGGGPSSWSHVFNRNFGVVRWQEDSHTLRYQRSDFNIDDTGAWEKPWWSVDVNTGETRRMLEAEQVVGVATGSGTYLSLQAEPGARRHLVEKDREEHPIRDDGNVGFQTITRVLTPYISGSQRQSVVVLAVGYQSREGIATLSTEHTINELPTNDNIRQCALDSEGDQAVCVLESLTQPPEIVSVSTVNGSVRALAELNPHAEAAQKLDYERADWINKYGHANYGYIQYPRGYVRGRRYPTVVISHGDDAKNRFPPGALWDFPIQLLAERGYVVLLVNESPVEFEKFGGLFSKGDSPGVNEAQRAFGLDAVASVEASVVDLVHRGIVDSDRVGIAGWSRGGEVVGYAMSQSKTFKVGIIADGYIGADIYWMGGINEWPRVGHIVYGGSPYNPDPRVLSHYRQFAPGFRAADFSGPLLLFAPSSGAVVDDMEPFRFLTEVKIPVEITYFPDEGHIFWDPHHRAFVMQRTLQWFDYWLRGQKTGGPGTEDAYRRWDAKAKLWRH